MPTTYTVRRITRPKQGNPLIEHHGIEILQVDGLPARYYGSDVSTGRPITIDRPIIDYGIDQPVMAKSRELFALKLPITEGPIQHIGAAEFEQRFQTILADTRSYTIGERDCESTADTLIEGKPQHRQLIGGLVGFALLMVGIAIVGKK